MGSSSSTTRRDDQLPPPPPAPPPPPSRQSPLPRTPAPPPPPPSSHNYGLRPGGVSYMSPAGPPLPPPPPPNPFYNYNYNHNDSRGFPGAGSSSYIYNANNRQNDSCPPVPNYHPQPFYPSPPPPAPAPYVDHTHTKTVKNEVNVKKETIRLVADENNPDCVLLSFAFDANVEGRFTIFYLAKEVEGCSFRPQLPEVFESATMPFDKGAVQKFCQPSGSGVDLGFFELETLTKVSDNDTYPLVIVAESSTPSSAANMNSQITMAVLMRKAEWFEVKVVKQVLFVDGVRYELQELYGLEASTKEVQGDDDGKECVICMTEPKSIAVMPCRHVCLCSGCAEILRYQSNKCPICRNPVEHLMEIKISG